MSRPTERVVRIDCRGESLVGIVHCPHRPPTLGVVVIVGGPQYRAGSHRQFVLLARALAEAGFAALRFDFRGMGDSGGDTATFEQVEPDIGSAIDALQAQVPSVERVVLWGLCDGASAALIYLDGQADRRVAGLCLLNPYVRSAQSLAKAHLRHYYIRRLRDRSFWAKLLRGGIGVGAVRGLANDIVTAGEDSVPFRSRMRRGWERFAGDILLVLSGNDLTAREFADLLKDDAGWQRALNRCAPTRLDVEGADHTFSDRALREDVEAATVAWLQALSSRTAGLVEAVR